MVNCKKCGNSGKIILRKKDHYCEECFVVGTSHKFRACIGKNKIIPAKENVLICLSGGPGSTVLLDLIFKGTTLDNFKRLWITPIFFHILGREQCVDNEEVAKCVIEQCQRYRLNVHIVHISEYLMTENKLPEKDTVPYINPEANSQFYSLVDSMSVSTKNDFLQKISRDLYIRYAKLFHCNFIFTAETSGTLAKKLLCNLTNGRGAQVQHDIGFCDTRDTVKIVRPMKDISNEEIKYYIEINQLMVGRAGPKDKFDENSLQSVINQFITDLQDNFQSTISTVCKTADKMGIQNKKVTSNKCTLCKSVIEENHKLSALEATKYSRTISMGQNCPTVCDNTGLNMFPYVNQYLCYTCSKNFSEMDNSILPITVRSNLKN